MLAVKIFPFCVVVVADCIPKYIAAKADKIATSLIEVGSSIAFISIRFLNKCIVIVTKFVYVCDECDFSLKARLTN